MKNERLLKELTNIDDAFIEEADRENIEKVKAKVKKRRLLISGSIAACIAVLVTVVNLWLFMPYSFTKVWQYRGSEYYDVIRHVNEIRLSNLPYENNFQYYIYLLTSDNDRDLEHTGGLPGFRGESGYFELTDNQEQGIIEGDLFKRNGDYVYYLGPVEKRNGLRKSALYIYSVQGENSELVAEHIFPVWFNNSAEMYLSEDCDTIIVVDRNNVYTYDISDVTRLTPKDTFSASSRCETETSRLVDGKLLLISKMKVNAESFSVKENYVPFYYGKTGEPVYMEASELILPKGKGGLTYSVVYMLDVEDLSVIDSLAVLADANNFYISQDHIILANQFFDDTGRNTEIMGISYGASSLEHKGSIVIDCWIRNQYSFCQKDKNLYVVADAIKGEDKMSTITAAFYCISTENWEVVKKIESFAPDGEFVNSVRFSDDKAYVCTSKQKKQNYVDPIFIFDIKDPGNITVKRSADMEGFSSSLVDFKDGTLLGIGQVEWSTLKIDIYKEGADRVDTICSNAYEKINFSREYKSYYIDRANGVVGFMVKSHEDASKKWVDEYWVFTFDGNCLKLTAVPLGDYVDNLDRCRSFSQDGYFYVFCEEKAFVAKDGEIIISWGNE